MKILSLNDLGGESEKLRGFLKKLQAGLSIFQSFSGNTVIYK